MIYQCATIGPANVWDETSEQLKDVPLIKNFLRSKVRHYNPDQNLADQAVTSCIICMEEFGIDDPKELVELDCNLHHIFHIDCLEEWLEQETTCPLCREEIKG